MKWSLWNCKGESNLWKNSGKQSDSNFWLNKDKNKGKENSNKINQERNIDIFTITSLKSQLSKAVRSILNKEHSNFKVS